MPKRILPENANRILVSSIILVLLSTGCLNDNPDSSINAGDESAQKNLNASDILCNFSGENLWCMVNFLVENRTMVHFDMSANISYNPDCHEHLLMSNLFNQKTGKSFPSFESTGFFSGTELYIQIGDIVFDNYPGSPLETPRHMWGDKELDAGTWHLFFSFPGCDFAEMSINISGGENVSLISTQWGEDSKVYTTRDFFGDVNAESFGGSAILNGALEIDVKNGFLGELVIPMVYIGGDGFVASSVGYTKPNGTGDSIEFIYANGQNIYCNKENPSQFCPLPFYGDSPGKWRFDIKYQVSAVDFSIPRMYVFFCDVCPDEGEAVQNN